MAGAAAPGLSPDAERLVAEMRERARAYRPRQGRTHLFVRAQYKYGLERDDYIHRWYDRPIWQDSSLRTTLPGANKLHPAAWKRTAAFAAAAGFDGFGACYSRFSHDVPQRTLSTGSGLLVELPYQQWFGCGPQEYMAAAEAALNLPNAFRMDGKTVLSRYPEARANEFERFASFRRDLAERYGDKFVVMPYSRIFDERPEELITADYLLKQRESLRTKLRSFDGFFPSGWVRYLYGKRYDGDFERRVLVPFIQSVLAEEEFAGKKYLAMQLYPGHENCYLWRYAWDSCGTATLCDQLETIVALKPDFALACEWDEENENDCFRPMLSHGTTRLRIVRSYTDRMAGRTPTLFPGDEAEAASVPNLVLSYRKSVIAGEPLEAEVRVIPDGTFVGETLLVAVRWKDPDGKVVKTFPAQRLPADVCTNAWFVARASEFVGEHPVLMPELAVKTRGGRTVYGEGFWPVDLDVARARDAKWIMMPLRDRPRATTGTLVAAESGDGDLRISGMAESAIGFRSVEVLEGPDTVYMKTPADEPGLVAPGMVPDRMAFRVAWQGYEAAKKLEPIDGTLEWRGAPGLRVLKRAWYRVKDNVWQTKGRRLDHWDCNNYVDLPNEEIDGAELVVDLKPFFKGTIRLADVRRLGAVGIPGFGGGNLVVSRQETQIAIPPPLDQKKAEFSFRLRPRTKSGVLRLQTVDADGRVWRSRPVVFGRPSGQVRKVHVIERDLHEVSTVTMDASRLEEPSYDFRPDAGSVLLSSEGRAYHGVLGGFTPLVSGLGQGETIYGNPLAVAMRPPVPNWDRSSPMRVKESDGSWSIAFTNCAFVSLPMQLLPPFCGFEIDMEVLPLSSGKEQGLVGDGNFGMGLWVRPDGRPEMRSEALAAPATGPALRVGMWNRVKVVCDRSQVWVETDGIAGQRTSVIDGSCNPVYTALGATPGYVNRPGGFFDGRIRSFSVKLR